MLKVILVLAATAADAFRSRRSLLTELALLRHQLTVLQRSVARPRITRFDRLALVALADETLKGRYEPQRRASWRGYGPHKPAAA